MGFPRASGPGPRSWRYALAGGRVGDMIASVAPAAGLDEVEALLEQLFELVD
jgi:hypothetical protein